MLNLLENKIIMQQGDDCSFRISVLDLDQKEVILSPLDNITMRLYKEGLGLVLEKEAEKTYENLEDEANLIFLFNFIPEDTKNLHSDNYFYDVVLVTEEKRYTIIPKNVFCLESSMEYVDSSISYDINEEIEYDTYDYDMSSNNIEVSITEDYVSSEKLVGVFSYVTIEKISYESELNDLILF